MRVGEELILQERLGASGDQVDPSFEASPSTPGNDALTSERTSVRDVEVADGSEAAMDGATRTRRERHVPWDKKAAVIDQLNELIDELKDIESNIALRVRLTDHILWQWQVGVHGCSLRLC